MLFSWHVAKTGWCIAFTAIGTLVYMVDVAVLYKMLGICSGYANGYHFEFNAYKSKCVHNSGVSN